MYFSSSKDILFIVIAFAVLWLAIFLSWALYYLIGILKDARDTVNGIKKASDAIESAACHVKDKLGAFMNIASVGIDGVKMFMEKMSEKKGKKK
jgi:hypothetical protein